MTGVLAGYTYIITVVPVNILGDGYLNETIGYLNIIIKCVMFTLHAVIISEEAKNTTATCVITLISTYEYHGKNTQYNVF